MTAPFLRKGRQVLHDPVLRRWLVRRLTGREPGPPAFRAGRPAYLDDDPVAHSAAPRWMRGDGSASFSPPQAPLSVALAGETVTVRPHDPVALFDRDYDDLETMLSAHRFAWVPLAGTAVGADWVAALWAAWVRRWGDRRDGWPWHAYTVAERAINIIDFAERNGLPGEPRQTLDHLAAHAGAIARNLEYFGEHYTSNHLSNDGRGLLRIGCACGLPEYAALGARIMTAEAARIFTRGGVLREGSTHYHLLLTRNYVDAWLDARAAGMAEAEILRDIALRALSVIPALRLPGGMPLIGDISPDCPPSYLATLADDRCGGWGDALPDDRRGAFAALRAAVPPISPDRAAEDGWHRFGGYGWTALAFVPPNGWPPMPGHGHQDLGSFELHAGEVPLLVDPGRGSYAETDYASAAVHNGIMIDSAEPAPVNRPYYAEAFRRRVAGAPPATKRTRGGYRLEHRGFSRLRGVGAASREWRFAENRVEIVDRIEGTGRHLLGRHFCTPHPVAADGHGGLSIDADGQRFVLSPSATAELETMTRWTAYGIGTPATGISCEETVSLPCERVTVIERA